MGITDYIIQSSMTMSQAKVQSDIQTTLLNKVMDNSEAIADQMIDQMEEVIPNFEGTFSIRV